MPRSASDDLWRILPRNATKLEQDLLRITPFHLLEPAVSSILTAKRNLIPESWLPWLILEYGLGRLQEFVPDSRTLLTEGLAFNRLIGTPAAIYMAADWVGMQVELVEETEPGLHFAEFQIRLISEVPADIFQICKLGRALDIAKPARSRFRRIYNDAWNVGRFILDDSDWGDILGNYSGIWAPDIPLCDNRELWVSLGVRHDLSPENSPLTGNDEVDFLTWAEEVVTTEIAHEDWPILDDEFADPADFYQAGMNLSLNVIDGLWTMDTHYFAALGEFGPEGDGSRENPWNVGTPAKFDYRMQAIYDSGRWARMIFADGDYYMNSKRPHEIHPVVPGVYASWYFRNGWFIEGAGKGLTAFLAAPGEHNDGDATGSRIMWRTSRRPNEGGFLYYAGIKDCTIDGRIFTASVPGPSTSYTAAIDVDGSITIENVHFQNLGGRGQEQFPVIVGCGLPLSDPSNPPEINVVVKGCSSDNLWNAGNGTGLLINTVNVGHHTNFHLHHNNFKDMYFNPANAWHILMEDNDITNGRADYSCYNADTGDCRYHIFRRNICRGGGASAHAMGGFVLGSRGNFAPGVAIFQHITCEANRFVDFRAPSYLQSAFMITGASDYLTFIDNIIEPVPYFPNYGVVYYDEMPSPWVPGYGLPGYWTPPPNLNGPHRYYRGNRMVDGSVPLHMADNF